MAGCDSKFDSQCRELLKILPELQCFKCKDVPGPGPKGVRLLHKRCVISAEKGLYTQKILISKSTGIENREF